MTEQEPGQDLQKKQDETKDQQEQLPTEEILQRLPKGVREAVGIMMSVSGPVPNPLLGKITTQHISQLINNQEKENDRRFQTDREERSHNFKIFIVAIGAIIALTVFLVFMKEKDILMNIIAALFGFAGGFGVGRYFKK